MSIADLTEQTLRNKDTSVVPIKPPAPTALGYIAGAIQKLVFKDLMTLARGMEGNLETDVARAESLLAWAEKFENPDASK